MSRRDPLDAIVRDASAEVRAQLVAAGRRRDFAAMIARARTIDPSSVSADDAVEASTFAPVVVLHGSSRAEHDRALAPPPRVLRRMSPALIGVAIGIAAMLLLSIAGVLVRRQNASLHGEAASHHITPSPRYDRAVLHDEGQTTSANRSRVDNRRTQPEEIHADVNPVDRREPEDTTQANAEGPTSVEAPPALPTPSAGRTLQLPKENLDRSARAAWRRGELRSASELFKKFIAVEQDPRQVEQAFGDLLIVARQLGEHRALSQIRRDYLRRFPTGTYAEDIGARICRDSGERECWQHYIKRWPSGAHADEARRALAK